MVKKLLLLLFILGTTPLTAAGQDIEPARRLSPPPPPALGVFYDDYLTNYHDAIITHQTGRPLFSQLPPTHNVIPSRPTLPDNVDVVLPNNTDSWSTILPSYPQNYSITIDTYGAPSGAGYVISIKSRIAGSDWLKQIDVNHRGEMIREWHESN